MAHFDQKKNLQITNFADKTLVSNEPNEPRTAFMSRTDVIYIYIKYCYKYIHIYIRIHIYRHSTYC